MPSIDINWIGKCTDYLVQESLITKISEFSEISNRLYQEFYHEEPEHEVYEDTLIDDKTPIDKYLFKGESIPDYLNKLNNRQYFSKNSSLYGLEFSLFDPRSHRTESSKMSFVFIRSSNEYLDGRMVSIIPFDMIGPNTNYCPFYLGIPRLDVRYYLENWIFGFLSWVRHFYVPDLHSLYHEGNSGYNAHNKLSIKDVKTRDELFHELCSLFTEEAADWSIEILKERLFHSTNDSGQISQ